MKVNREKALKLIKGTKGKFFTVTWKKKDGSVRVANGRLHVQYQRTSQRGATYNPAERGLFPMWEVNGGGFKMVNVNTITKVTFNNTTYEVS